MRYAAAGKPDSEPLDQFIKREAGMQRLRGSVFRMRESKWGGEAQGALGEDK
jgi:hypothetical protein